MIKHGKSYAGLGLIVMALTWLAGEAAWAASDCEELYQGIRKERVLMAKKALVEAARQVCPDDPDIAYQAGYIQERLRNYEEALAGYRETIAMAPGYAKAYFSIGDIKALAGDYGEAAAAYREGLRHDPGDRRAKSSLQEVLAKTGATTAATDLAPAGQEKEKPEETAEPAEPVKEERKKTVPPTKVAQAAPQYGIKPITRLHIPFEGKTATLSRESRDVLAVVVGQAMTRDDMRDVRLEVGGYTDNSGSVESNMEIGRQRAAAVKEYLTEEFGINPARLKTVSYGREKPKLPNDSPENRRSNNRVEFRKLD